VTTPEEYQAQHYEGGSTLFGPDTFPIYKYIYEYLGDALIEDRALFDNVKRDNDQIKPYPLSVSMRNVIKENSFAASSRKLRGWFDQSSQKALVLKETYNAGDMVRVDLDALNPNRYDHRNASVIVLQRLNALDSWVDYKKDDDPAVMFKWKANAPFGKGQLEVSWLTSREDKAKSYRVCFHSSSVAIKKARPAGFDRCTASFSLI
jgi:neutral ceramidase